MEQHSVRDTQSNESSIGDSTTKPEAPSWVIDNISNTSKNASQVYVLYLSVLSYCVLTIFTTSDDQLFLNQSTLLPLINLNVPSNLFFTFGPLIALGLFVQLQFYLYRLNEMMEDAEKHYAPIAKGRLYPWLITFAEEETDGGLVGALQRRAVELSLWWLLPSVLAMFAFWTFRRHHVEMSVVLAIINLLGTCLVVFFWTKRRPNKSRGRSLLLFFSVSFQGLLLVVLFFSVRPGYPGTRHAESVNTRFGALTAQLRIAIRTWTAVDLSYRDFSDTKLRTFLMQDLQNVHLEGAELAEISFPEVANLSGAYLQSANLEQAQLQKVKLCDAHLQEADLSSANLTGACLNAAWLTKSFLPGAVLTNARLVRAHLRRAFLGGADLRSALLGGSDLRQAKLTSGAKLGGADFRNADLEGADLTSADGLTAEQLSLACTLHNAILDRDLSDEIRSRYPSLLERAKRGNDDGPCISPSAR